MIRDRAAMVLHRQTTSFIEDSTEAGILFGFCTPLSMQLISRKEFPPRWADGPTFIQNNSSHCALLDSTFTAPPLLSPHTPYAQLFQRLFIELSKECNRHDLPPPQVHTLQCTLVPAQWTALPQQGSMLAAICFSCSHCLCLAPACLQEGKKLA